MRINIKLLTLLLALVMLLQASAATILAIEPIDIDVNLYASADPNVKQHDYRDDRNSGIRGEYATSLLGTSADDYYTGSNEYEVLSQQSASQIVSALRSLMTTTHTTITNYNDCKTEAKYTDGENNQIGVNLIYTGVFTTADLNGSNTWNREHVWPKSLAWYEESGAGADLHHIRPSDCTANSTRNNHKYGNVTMSSSTAKYGKNSGAGKLAGYLSGDVFMPNYASPQTDSRGDVARICLYLLVRYDADAKLGYSGTFGKSLQKVFYASNFDAVIDLILSWCEADPVDTWELGRNEVIQNSYQGNRNVFIDYPEYAWLIFGREVPETMTTPSGEAKNGSGSGSGNNTGSGSGDSTHTHTYTTTVTKPTCTSQGYTTHACTCGYSYKDTYTSVINHTYQNGVCSTCGASDANTPKYTPQDFRNAMAAFESNPTGKGLYDAIYSAASIYNYLSATDKATVSTEYGTLKSIINDYNSKADSINKDANTAHYDLLGYSISVVSFALYSIVNKKFI